jgi:hypothetical protein
MITCQHEWVEQCQLKYRLEPLPNGEHWEDAHYPVPECLGGTETVKLWSRDHAVHGFLQSEELDQVCFHGYRRKTDRAFIEVYYPEYLKLCDQWFIKAQKRAFQSRVKKNPNCQSEAASVSAKLQRSREPYEVQVARAASMRKKAKKEDLARGGLMTASKINSQRWVDPDHPELGEHSAPTLTQMQKRRGYPHGKENRRQVG